MDDKIQILLGSRKNVDSVNVDTYGRVQLTNDASELTEFTVNDKMNSTRVFDAEREANPVYRIYGRIDYLSLLNGLINNQSVNTDNYRILDDFFNPVYTGASKNIYNSFSFYLVKPATTGYQQIYVATDEYIRYFEVVATPNDFELFSAGFSNNVYGEQEYAFNFKKDFNVSEYFDQFGFPVTELFLYAQYNLKRNGWSVDETMKYTKWSSYGVISKENFIPTSFSIGDIIQTGTDAKIGDHINYNKPEFEQTVLTEQTVYIKTEYKQSLTSSTSRYLVWKYQPFIPFRLRYLSDELYTREISRLPENTTTLEISLTGTSSGKLNATKSQAQILRTSVQTIENWNPYSSTLVDWDEEDGIADFTIPATFSYNIRFQSEVHFPQNSYIYYAKIWIQEDTGSGWVDIPSGSTTFSKTGEPQAVTVMRSYSYGDRIRTRVQLIPNPAEIVPEPTEIPYYATQVTEDGIYVWRDIVPQGYTEPLTGNGVDYPFFNKRRYLFSPLVLSISPDMNDSDNGYNTRTVFSEIGYTRFPSSLDITPLSQLDDIGKPCK